MLELAGAAAAAPSSSISSPPAPPPDLTAELPPGARIGHYTILGVLGVGGMGVVYRARQDAPARDVALKLIRAELASTALIRRFEHEAAALALLRHPGIAQVYEAGAADLAGSPRPFIAMELVDGPRLDEFVNHTKPDRAALLRLFIQICEAVDHAHRRGIVHRDLKPANILVESDEATERRSDEGEDPSPAHSDLPSAPPPSPSVASSLSRFVAFPRTVASPKILDFGVAKFRDPSSTLEATQAGGFIGTLAYASPEQLAGDPAAIDARADVYALGVILYQLLVGARPYHLDGAFTDVVAAVSSGRIIPPESRGVTLPADLRTVLYKSLAPDPARRYQSSALLAEDLRRFLDKRPILARGDSTTYILRKAVARHPYRAAAALIFIALTLGAAATMFVLQSRAVRAEQAKSGVLESVLAGLGRTNPDEPDTPRVISIDDFLDDVAPEIERRLEGFPEEQNLVLAHLGRANLGHRRLEEAETQLAHVAEYRAARAAADPLAYARALFDLGLVRYRRGSFAAALDDFRKCLALRAAAIGDADPATIEARYHVGAVLLAWRRYDDAETELRAAAEMQSRIAPGSPEAAEYLAGISACMRATGRYEEALRDARRALDLVERDPRLGPDSKLVAVAISNVTANLISLGRYNEAEPLLSRALAIREKHFGPSDPRVADTLVIIASLNMRRGQWGQTDQQRAWLDQAAAAAERTLALRAAVHTGDHELIAETLSLLGQIRMRQGRYDDAIPHLTRAADMRRRLPHKDDGDLGRSESILGECLTRAGRTTDGRAEQLLKDGLDKVRATFGPTHRNTREALERLLAFFQTTRRDEDARIIQELLDRLP